MRREDIPTIPSRIEYAVNPLQDPIVVSSLQRNAAFEAIFRDADAGLPPPEDLKSRVAEDRLQLLTIFYTLRLRVEDRLLPHFYGHSYVGTLRTILNQFQELRAEDLGFVLDDALEVEWLIGAELPPIAGPSVVKERDGADRRLFLSSGAVLFVLGVGDLLNQVDDCASDRRIRQLRIGLDESNCARHG